MPGELEDIWAGDKLKRREEAQVLEQFLKGETAALRSLGRDQALVLALDAQYGEGKSWFLSRFRRQLDVQHPVAFIDAWVDDANQEPLVSIMAAIEDALEPFLTEPKVKEKLGALTRAALPIIGKAAIGAGGKLLSRYIGDSFGDETKSAINAASSKEAKKDNDGPIETAVDKAADGVAELVDSAGKAMLKQYRTRQESRKKFKESLRQLAQSIDNAHSSYHTPVFVVLDELDRCRPSYAISILEEIKHLFDVPGIVFVIALHGSQLEHSIKAVYGEGFDAKSYLRRFFTRRYELRRLSLSELVQTQFDAIPSEISFSSPEARIDGKVQKHRPSVIAGALLSQWGATPREAEAVIDGLRLFASNWDHANIEIELPLALGNIFQMIRGETVSGLPTQKHQGSLTFTAVVLQAGNERERKLLSQTDVEESYSLAMSSTLTKIVNSGVSKPAFHYVRRQMQKEMNYLHGGNLSLGREPSSVLREYASRVQAVGRFIQEIDQNQ